MIADSPRAARYAGMRTRRKILAVMAVSGAIAGIGGASQIGDFTYTLDGSPTGLQAAAFGYTGIVVAALARYNPLAVCLVAVLIGGLLNAGLHAPGPGLPVGARRRDAGDHPLLRARRRAAAPLPAADSTSLDAHGGSEPAAEPRHERERQPARHRPRAGGPLRDAAPLCGARRAARRALRSAQPRRRGDDAVRRGGRVLDDAARRRLERTGARPRRPRVGRWPARRWPRSTRSSRSRCARTRSSRGSRSRSSRAVSASRPTSEPSSGSRRTSPRSTSSASLDVLGLARPAGARPDRLRPVRARVRVVGRGAPRRRSTSGERASGLNVRAVGEAPASADAMGINVVALPVRPRPRRRRVRRRRRRLLQPLDHAGLERRATRSSAAPAGSRSRSSSSRSGAPSSVSWARTSSGRCRRSRSRCRLAMCRSRRSSSTRSRT